MSYQALYRTWRPQSFASLVGQQHVRQTLMNAIICGQIAHAYLFCGPRGTGKTSAAKLFAKAVNCLHPQGAEPCNTCEACVSITQGSNVDVEEIDAASNRGVDEIRELRDKVHYTPTSVKRKVYIVDEVHMLTTEAFNALLKTLEEPPNHVLFMLATTEPHKIPGTIISRCQRFDFHRISTETIADRLREVVNHQGWHCDEAALWKVAEAADGGMRDALGLLEQAAAFGQGTIDESQVAEVIGGVGTGQLLQLITHLLDEAYLPALELIGSWYAAGKDAQRITFDLLQVMRDLFIVMLSQSDDALLGKPTAPYRAVAEHKACSQEFVHSGVSRLGELYTQMRYLEQPRLALEACLLQLATEAKPVMRSAAPQMPTHPTANAVPAGQTAPAPVASVQPASTERQPMTAQTAPVAERSAAERRQRPQQRQVSAARKQETMQKLVQERNPDLEQAVRERWGDILHKVKADRIQAHAWLLNGEVVLATDFAVVLSFASKIHREAVMKPADRQVIEAAITTMMERNMQILALLKEDWDRFVESLHPDQDEEVDTSSESSIVDRAKALFGEDKVMVENEE